MPEDVIVDANLNRVLSTAVVDNKCVHRDLYHTTSENLRYPYGRHVCSNNNTML